MAIKGFADFSVNPFMSYRCYPTVHAGYRKAVVDHAQRCGLDQFVNIVDTELIKRRLNLRLSPMLRNPDLQWDTTILGQLLYDLAFQFPIPAKIRREVKTF